jgi:hypothetical protein
MASGRSAATADHFGLHLIVRLYRPRQEIIDGAWNFPESEPVNQKPRLGASRARPGDAGMVCAAPSPFLKCSRKQLDRAV